MKTVATIKLMKLLIQLTVVVLTLLFSQVALAQQCEGTCLSKDEAADVRKVLEQKKCMQTAPPTFEVDPISLVLDKNGRVYYSGAQPRPYTLKMKWCGYEVEGKGYLDVVAALQEPPEWGFRFRPKAYVGVLLAEPFYDQPNGTNVGFDDVFDAGVMVDFFYVHEFNLNIAVGFQSFGAGIGMDITANFGAYLGYGLTWGSWHHNPVAGVWFGF